MILEGKTTLVLGYGAVGKRIARGCLGMVRLFCTLSLSLARACVCVCVSSMVVRVFIHRGVVGLGSPHSAFSLIV